MNTMRFWIHYRGAPVRLTIHDGETLEFGYSEPTEEGYSGEGERITRDGWELTREYVNFGRDCDGPIRSGGTLIWHPLCGTRLHDDIEYPAWQQADDTWVCDEYAQAAGY